MIALDEEVAFQRALATSVAINHIAEHPLHGPWSWEMTRDPMVEAVHEAGGAAIREWGDWWDGEAFLASLDAAGYRVVPK